MNSTMVATGLQITPSSTSQFSWSSVLHRSPVRLAKPCEIKQVHDLNFYCCTLKQEDDGRICGVEGVGEGQGRGNIKESSMQCWLIVQQWQLHKRSINFVFEHRQSLNLCHIELQKHLLLPTGGNSPILLKSNFYTRYSMGEISSMALTQQNFHVVDFAAVFQNYYFTNTTDFLSTHGT